MHSRTITTMLLPLLMLAAVLMLTACGTTTLISATDPARRDLCERAWKPVTYSSQDTPETQLQARQNNAAYDSYCKGKGK